MYKIRVVVALSLVLGVAMLCLYGNFIFDMWSKNQYHYVYFRQQQNESTTRDRQSELCYTNESLLRRSGNVDFNDGKVGTVHNYKNSFSDETDRGYSVKNHPSEHLKSSNSLKFQKPDKTLRSNSNTESKRRNFNVNRSQEEDLKEGRNLSRKWTTRHGIKNWRTLPQSLYKLAPNIFDSVPREFLPQFKNPCWYEKGNNLLCLPYFYFVGFPKCGTTDIWDKINSHPGVEKMSVKESQYWRDRKIGNDERGFEGYLSKANAHKSRLLSGDTNAVYCDGSVTTIISNYRFVPYSPNVTNDMYTNADIIHEITPNAKIIVGIREPVERLYSGYLYHPGKKNRSVSNFHKEATKYVEDFQRCLQRSHKLRCIFEKVEEDGDSQRLKVGMYAPLIKHWITRFGLPQVMVIRLEDWKLDCFSVLRKIFKFLELETLSRLSVKRICKKSARNVNNRTHNRIGEMWPSTKQMLQDFYAPFNEELSEYLNISVYHAQI